MPGKTSKKSVKVARRGGEAAAKRRGRLPAQAPTGTPARTSRRVREPADWRGEMLAKIRALIHEADPRVTEEVKWRKPSNSMLGVPVWSRDGILCTGETYKDKVKLTFANGAALEDPAGLFNAGLEGNTRRAIDLHEGDRIDETALKALLREAVAHDAKHSVRRSKGSRA